MRVGHNKMTLSNGWIGGTKSKNVVDGCKMSYSHTSGVSLTCSLSK